VAHYLYPDSRTMQLPITIGHVQESRRPRFERALLPLTPGINRFLREWIAKNAASAYGATAEDRLAFLASQLEDLAAAPASRHIELLTEYLRYARADLVERLQQQLGNAPDAPVYWASDVRRIVEANGKALLANEAPRLDDWPESITRAECAQRLRDSALELAAGYRVWPTAWRAAAELGDRLLPG
jgi:hypothetical protein